MKLLLLPTLAIALLLTQGCNAKQPATNPEASPVTQPSAQTEPSPIIQGLTSSVLSTPYSALIQQTDMDTINLGDNGEVTHRIRADVLDTYRGKVETSIHYSVIVEQGESLSLSEQPIVISLCRKANNAFYWPGVGSQFPATDTVKQTARKLGASADQLQNDFDYCEPE